MQEVIFIDSETLTVVTPPGIRQQGSNSRKPGRGEQVIYDQIVYGLPELEA